jgi:hypothetical protein
MARFVHVAVNVNVNVNVNVHDNGRNVRRAPGTHRRLGPETARPRREESAPEHTLGGVELVRGVPRKHPSVSRLVVGGLRSLRNDRFLST